MLHNPSVMDLLGTSFLGTRRASKGEATFYAQNPKTASPLDPPYHSATQDDLNHAVAQAAEAFTHYLQTTGQKKAAFLRRTADALDANKQDIAERANLETALPTARLLGEVTRTSNQLRLFASVVEEGSWVQARIDPALPDRQPLP